MSNQSGSEPSAKSTEASPIDSSAAIRSEGVDGEILLKFAVVCPLCWKSVNKEDPDNWKQVVGWVGGPKKDSMRLREDTGKIAHDECVKKLAQGQAPDQTDLFAEEEDSRGHASHDLPDVFSD